MVASRRQRFAIVIGSALLALVAGEIALRMGARWTFIDSSIVPDANLGWSLRPNDGAWATEENVVWVETNSAGFRDRERALIPAPGTRRVAVIGDSFIHGYFLPLEQSFPAMLEQYLAACASTSVEVLGFGVLQYNTTQELLTYRLHATRYSPSIVIVAVFTLNDIFDNHPRLSTDGTPHFVFDGSELVLDQRFRDHLPKPPRWPLRRWLFELLTTQWRTGELSKMAFDQWRERRGALPPDPEPAVHLEDHSIYRPPTIAEHDEAWRLTEAILLKFASEVSANGSEFWIATLFNTEQVDPDLNQRRALERELGVETLFYPDRRLAAFARENGIKVISLAEPLAEYTGSTGRYVNGGDRPAAPLGTGHWNATGVRLSAEYSARQICSGSTALRSR